MRNLKTLTLLLIAIGLDEAYNSSIIESSGNFSQLTKALISTLLFGAQVIFSPIQAGISDFRSRKKGLIIAFFVTSISLSLLLCDSKSRYFISFLIIAACLKGIGGNIIPISRAVLADSIKHNFRFAIGLTTSSIAAGYIFIAVISQFFNSFYVPMELLITTLVVLILILIFFLDRFDSIAQVANRSLRIEIIENVKSIYEDFLKDKIFFMSSLSYYFWEVSFYLVFIKDVELRSKNFENFSIPMCVGYLLGVLSLKLINKWHDQHVLRFGYRISTVSVITIFIASIFGVQYSYYVSILAYVVFSFGYGFFIPCLFSMISKVRQPHEQGKIYGLIDSVDTIAFATALLFGVFILNFKLIMVISFLFLIIGILIYHLSKKHWSVHEEKLKS